MAATACADIILVLQKGKLVEMGTHAQLLDAQGEYFRLHDLQAGGYR
jgi:ATP-binding cassette subfamily B protein